MSLSGGVQATLFASRASVFVILANIIFLCALFPFVAAVETPFSTQPWSVIMSAAAVLISLATRGGGRYPLPIWIMGIIALYALFMFLVQFAHFQGIRSIVGYASIVIIAMAAYSVHRYVRTSVFLFAVLVWLVVGIIQTIVDPEFARALLPRMSGGGVRGVSSLAIEPSYYATVCAFMLGLNEIFHGKKRYGFAIYTLVMVALIGQIIMSYAVLGMIFLFVFGAAHVVCQIVDIWKPKKILAVLMIFSVVGAVSFVYSEFASERRAGRVMELALKEPQKLIYLDASAGARALHILLPWQTLISGNVFGLGLGTWGAGGEVVLLSGSPVWLQELSEAAAVTPAGRVMSGWGTMIYEIGIVGLLLMLVIVWSLLAVIFVDRVARRAWVVSFALVFAIAFTAMPLAFPLFGYMIGVHLFYARYPTHY